MLSKSTIHCSFSSLLFRWKKIRIRVSSTFPTDLLQNLFPSGYKLFQFNCVSVNLLNVFVANLQNHYLNNLPFLDKSLNLSFFLPKCTFKKSRENSSFAAILIPSRIRGHKAVLEGQCAYPASYKD